MKKNNRVNASKLLRPLVLAAISIATLAFTYKSSSTTVKAGDNWRELGKVKAGHSGDHDVIHIDGPHDTFRKLKFRVEGSPLNMKRIVVTYDDGAPEKLETKNEIPKGGESRAIDLQGGKRKLKSVEFWFDTKGFLNGKAEVFLYGSK